MRAPQPESLSGRCRRGRIGVNSLQTSGLALRGAKMHILPANASHDTEGDSEEPADRIGPVRSRRHRRARAQGQTPAPQPPAPSADPYANNAAPGATQFPLAAPAGKDSGAKMTAPAGARESGPVRSGHVEVRHRLQPAGGREDLESGEAEDDGGRKGDRRHGVQRHRSGDLLRDGERRLRLHLDRDAAQRSRLGGGGADVAHLSRTRRRCPASASPTPTSARSSTRSTPARW